MNRLCAPFTVFESPRECPMLCVGMTEKERHVYEDQD
jgi:hypothetical protein